MDTLDRRTRSALVSRMALSITFASISMGVCAAPPPKGGSVGPLLVIDAAGKTVGRLATMGNIPVVYTTINGVLTSYHLAPVTQGTLVDWEKVQPLAGGQLYFTTPNCSGTPYMQDSDGTRAVARQSVVVRVAGENQLYLAQVVAPVSITIGAVFQTGGCAATGGGTVNAIPLNSPVNLSTMFAEPYVAQ